LLNVESIQIAKEQAARLKLLQRCNQWMQELKKKQNNNNNDDVIKRRVVLELNDNKRCMERPKNPVKRFPGRYLSLIQH